MGIIHEVSRSSDCIYCKDIISWALAGATLARRKAAFSNFTAVLCGRTQSWWWSYIFALDEVVRSLKSGERLTKFPESQHLFWLQLWQPSCFSDSLVVLAWVNCKLILLLVIEFTNGAMKTFGEGIMSTYFFL